MRVDDRKPGPAQSQPKTSFASQLKKAAPAPAAKPAAAPARPVAAKVAAKPIAGKAVTRSREAVSFQKGLEARRGESETHRPEHKRFAAEVARRLEPEAQSAPVVEPPSKVEAPPPVQAQPAPVEATPTPVRAEALAEQIAALLERVEVVQRAEGPALELALADCAAAQVRVTRTGKGEVALAISARTPAERRALQSQLGRVKASLQERGLRVRELVVA